MDDPDWSQLPSDLVISIGRKLTMYSDYVRLRGVCWGWRSSLPPVPCNLPLQFPWLLFSQGRRRGFYDPLSRKIHSLNLPDASHPRRICCSSKGWLVVLEEGPNILCLNPLTRAKVYLPPLSSFPNVTAFDFCNVGREFTIEDRDQDQIGNVCTRNLKQMRDSFLKKIVLSESPANGADFVAMSMVSSYSGSVDLAFCKKGDASWKFIPSVPSTTPCFYEDVIYCNGLFYGVASTGQVSVIDVTDGDHPRVTVIRVMDNLSPLGGGDLQYLVHSGDRLLLVCRRLELEDPDYESVYETCSIEVYWLNLDESIPKWELVDNLENHVLFLGKNTSFSLRVSDFPGCNGNRVYFTDDHSEYNNYDVDVVVAPPCYDMGIFNLTDHCIEKLPYFVQSSSTASALAAPLWISPNPC